MAHIPDGVLSAPVLVTGGLATTGLLAFALRRLDTAQIPTAAVLAAAFFVASLISVPIGPGSVHLLLNGLMGLLLGWTALPALAVALLLQAAFFGFGGLVALGVNILNMGLPALACALLLRPALRRTRGPRVFWIGAAAGGLGVLFTALMIALVLAASGQALVPAARVLVLVYLPLTLVESLITGTVVGFLERVEPEVLHGTGGDHA
jgi:cobalt/nickel transport system permease protein